MSRRPIHAQRAECVPGAHAKPMHAVRLWQALTHGFAMLPVDERLTLLEELMAAIPSNRRSETLTQVFPPLFIFHHRHAHTQAPPFARSSRSPCPPTQAFEGSGEEEQGPALAAMMCTAGPFVRRAAFTLISLSPEDFPPNERTQLLRLGSVRHALRSPRTHGPSQVNEANEPDRSGPTLCGSRVVATDRPNPPHVEHQAEVAVHVAVQTDLSVEQFFAKAEAVAAAAAAAEAAEEANWEARAGERRKAAKVAVTQVVSFGTSPKLTTKLTKKGLLEQSSRDLLVKAEAEEAGVVGAPSPFGANYSSFFGNKKIPHEDIALPKLVPAVAQVICLLPLPVLEPSTLTTAPSRVSTYVPY